MLPDEPLKFKLIFASLQVNVAFNIVYNSGLNEYALYLDCEGGRRSHRGYEMTMSHLFKNYRKNPHTHKVSVSVCGQVLLALLFIVLYC